MAKDALNIVGNTLAGTSESSDALAKSPCAGSPTNQDAMSSSDSSSPTMKTVGDAASDVASGDNVEQPKLGRKAAPRIPRPMNSFMIFAKKCRKSLQNEYPNLDNKIISTMLGDEWKKLTDDERDLYAQEAKELAEKHKQEHPDWKFKRDTLRKKRKSTSSPLNEMSPGSLPPAATPFFNCINPVSSPSVAEYAFDARRVPVSVPSSGNPFLSMPPINLSLSAEALGFLPEQFSFATQMNALDISHSGMYARCPPPSYVAPPPADPSTIKAMARMDGSISPPMASSFRFGAHLGAEYTSSPTTMSLQKYLQSPIHHSAPDLLFMNNAPPLMPNPNPRPPPSYKAPPDAASLMGNRIAFRLGDDSASVYKPRKICVDEVIHLA